LRSLAEASAAVAELEDRINNVAWTIYNVLQQVMLLVSRVEALEIAAVGATTSGAEATSTGGAASAPAASAPDPGAWLAHDSQASQGRW
jgi:hypothetical protein